jgi:hypothetical protein
MGERTVPIAVSHEYPGSEIEGDALEFIRAMAAYQKRYQRRYPAWSEVLYVLRTLGYTKRVPGATWGAVQTVATDDADQNADEEDQNESCV